MSDIKKRNSIIMMVSIVACVFLIAFIELVIEPAYIIKSLLKIITFTILPIITMKLLNIKIFDSKNALDKKKIFKLLIMGIIIYSIIMVAYFIANNFFDFSTFIKTLSSDQNVSSKYFIYVALYISFCNSFIEEFLFRYVSFIKLSEFISKKTTYLFSSILFAVYHVFMLESSFPPIILFLMLIGLFVGGYIFDFVDDKDNNMYNSWIIHMFADFAIMTVWFINI